VTPARDLDRVYVTRFDAADSRRKMAIWAEIAAFLQRWIPPDAVVLDIACDEGFFIRNANAGERWATDLRDMREVLPAEVRFVQADGLSIDTVLPLEYFDVVFMSNYLEHLPSGDAVLAQMRQVHRVLKPGGRMIVLQPNIRFVGNAYWDFIDHKVPITDRSLAEAATAAGFKVERLIPRLLPYSTKGRLPQHPALVRAYLRVPLAWRLLGKQSLLVATRQSGVRP
jgi:SAM-dependent methyltransferase